ncbi:MAG: hypothetical protein Ct9H90mP16_16170 [Candidatus Poseidoniales archaeon]|nr:MAG: hypothetical protein Ct9H90mP16_16170 [Candidatus Poseidoniales archaeon]
MEMRVRVWVSCKPQSTVEFLGLIWKFQLHRKPGKTHGFLCDSTSGIASSHLPAASSADEIVDFVNENSSAGKIIKCCYQGVEHSSSLHIF